MKNNELKAMAIAAAVAAPAAVLANPTAVFADTVDDAVDTNVEQEHVAETEDADEELAAELEHAESELNSAEQERNEAETACEEARQTADEAETARDQAVEEAQDAFEDVKTDAEDGMRDAEQSLEDAKQERENAEAEAEAADSAVTEAEAGKNDVEQELREAESAAEETVSETTEDEKTKEETESSEDTDSTENPAHTEKSLNDRLEDKIRNSDAAVADAEQNLNEANAQMEQELSDQQQAVDEAQEAADDAEQALRDFDAEQKTENLDQQIVDAEEDKAGADTKYSDAQKALEEKQGEVDRTKEALDEAKDAVENAGEASEEEIAAAEEEADHAAEILKIREEEMKYANATVGTIQVRNSAGKAGDAAPATYTISIPGVDIKDVSVYVSDFDNSGSSRYYIGYENGTFYAKYQVFVDGRNYTSTKSYEDAVTWYNTRVANGAFTGNENLSIQSLTGNVFYEATWTDANGEKQSQIFRISSEEMPGSSEEQTTADSADAIYQGIVDSIITEDMSDYDKLKAIVEYVAHTYSYDGHYNSAMSMIEHGGGSCWSSTYLVQELGTRAGLDVHIRNGNRDPLAGSGHINNITEIDGVLYITDAGFVGTAPRYYDIEKSSGFSTYYLAGGGKMMYQYEGRDENVYIPEGTTKIGANAFAGGGYAVDYKNIYIPASVETIGTITSNLWTLEGVHVDEANENYKSIDGCLYSKDGKSLIFIPKSKKYVVVPDTVEAITDSSILYSATAGKGTRIIVGAKGSAAESFVESYNANAVKGYELIFIDNTDPNYEQNLACALNDYEEAAAAVELKTMRNNICYMSPEEYREASAQIQRDYEEALSAYENAQANLTKLTSGTQELQTRVKELNDAYQALLTEYDSLAADVDTAKTDAEEAASKLSNLQQQKAQLDAERAELVNAVNDSNAVLQSETTKLESMRADLAVTNPELQAQINAAQQAYDTALAGNEKLHSVYDRLLTAQDSYTEATQTLADAEKQQAEAAGRLAQAEAAETKAAAALENAKAQLERVSALSYEDALETPVTDPDYSYLNTYIDAVKAAQDAYDIAAQNLAAATADLQDKNAAYNTAFDHYRTVKAEYDLQESIKNAAGNPDAPEIVVVPTEPDKAEDTQNGSNGTSGSTTGGSVVSSGNVVEDAASGNAGGSAQQGSHTGNSSGMGNIAADLENITATQTADGPASQDTNAVAAENTASDAQTGTGTARTSSVTTTATASTQSVTTAADSVATGDNSAIPAMVAELLLAGGALYVLGRKKKTTR